jgi:hypothetical protein
MLDVLRPAESLPGLKNCHSARLSGRPGKQLLKKAGIIAEQDALRKSAPLCKGIVTTLYSY